MLPVGSITADTPVEELVKAYPGAVGFLMRRDIICLVCGEVFWGTLGELMEQKHIENPTQIIEDLRAFLQAKAAG